MPEYDAYIEWDSSDSSIINFAGIITPEKNKAVEVTLQYKVTIGENEKTGTKNVIVSPVSIDTVIDRFEKQFSSFITRDYNVKNEFYELFKVEWYSTDETLFDNNGKYHKPRLDTEFEIKYVVKCNQMETEE